MIMIIIVMMTSNTFFKNILLQFFSTIFIFGSNEQNNIV